jgi:hypothetical protein
MPRGDFYGAHLLINTRFLFSSYADLNVTSLSATKSHIQNVLIGRISQLLESFSILKFRVLLMLQNGNTYVTPKWRIFV